MMRAYRPLTGPMLILIHLMERGILPVVDTRVHIPVMVAAFWCLLEVNVISRWDVHMHTRLHVIL